MTDSAGAFKNAVEPSAGRGRLRRVLFTSTGITVPFSAFAPFHLLGRPLDLATIFAALFVLASAGCLLRWRPRRALLVFLAGAAAVPLLALFPPRPPLFAPGEFLRSYAHWMLFVLFFAAAWTLQSPPLARRALAASQVAAGVLVAAFGLYQVVGIPRHWPGTGAILAAFQRGPFILMPIGTYQRPTSVFLEPSWLGGYLAWIAVLAFGLWTVPAAPAAPGRRRFLLVPALALFLLVLLTTLSWGSYVDGGVAAAGALALVLRGNRMSRTKVAVGLLLMVVAVAVLSRTAPGRRAVDAATTRWEDLRATSLQSSKGEEDWTNSSWLRYHNVEHTIHLWKLRPVQGVGLGQFHRYKNFAGGREVFAAESWCGWLGVAAEAGILGPTVLAAAILLVLWRASGLPREDFASLVVPLLTMLAVVEQLRTASYIDLWWWFPLSLAAALSSKGQTVLAGPTRRASMPTLGAE